MPEPDLTTQTVWPDLLGLVNADEIVLKMSHHHLPILSLALSDWLQVGIALGLLIAVCCYVLLILLQAGEPEKRFSTIVLRAGGVLAVFRLCCLWYLALFAKSAWEGWSFYSMIVVSYPEGFILRGLPDLGTSSRVADAAIYSVILTLTTFALVALCALLVKTSRRWSRW